MRCELVAHSAVILPRHRLLPQGEEFLQLGCRKLGQPALAGADRLLGFVLLGFDYSATRAAIRQRLDDRRALGRPLSNGSIRMMCTGSQKTKPSGCRARGL